MSTLTGFDMTLSDVADAARVRRQVVTTWRSRPVVAGELCPFPPAVRRESGSELFDAEAVVAWLELTGRGNNAEVRADAPAHVRLPEVLSAGVDATDAAEALLCLKARSDATLGELDADDLLDLADEEDPDDEFLFSEIEQLGPDLPRLATFVDALSDAAYGSKEALARLDARRPRTEAHSKLALAPDVVALAGELGAALALDLRSDEVTFADPTGCAADLASACLVALGERVAAEVSVGTDTSAARSARRGHVIRGSRITRATPSVAVVLARFPHAGSPGMGHADVLDAIDDLQLELPETQRTIIVGPAAVLCDALPDRELDAQRDHLLRLGRLRCAVRLPKGLAPGSGRQALGLWVLGPDRPHAAAQDRWVTTGDLSDLTLTGDVVADVSTDVVASMSMTRLARSRTFRHLRPSLTSVLLAGRGPLVAAGIRPSPPDVTQSAQRVLHLRELVTRAGLDDRIAVGPAGGESRMPSLTLGEALASGAVKPIRGARLDVAGLDVGSVRVITVEALAGGESRVVDPMAVERANPRARRTEPGDVVFATAPHPRAMVDRDGFSFVAFPARVLRCDAQRGVQPDVLAAAINAQPIVAREWRGWAVPVVHGAQGEDFNDVVRLIVDERATLLQRVAGLDELRGAITNVSVAGSVSISLHIAQRHEKCDDMQQGETL